MKNTANFKSICNLNSRLVDLGQRILTRWHHLFSKNLWMQVKYKIDGKTNPYCYFVEYKGSDGETFQRCSFKYKTKDNQDNQPSNHSEDPNSLELSLQFWSTVG